MPPLNQVPTTSVVAAWKHAINSELAYQLEADAERVPVVDLQPDRFSEPATWTATIDIRAAVLEGQAVANSAERLYRRFIAHKSEFCVTLTFMGTVEVVCSTDFHLTTLTTAVLATAAPTVEAESTIPPLVDVNSSGTGAGDDEAVLSTSDVTITIVVLAALAVALFVAYVAYDRRKKAMKATAVLNPGMEMSRMAQLTPFEQRQAMSPVAFAMGMSNDDPLTHRLSPGAEHRLSVDPLQSIEAVTFEGASASPSMMDFGSVSNAAGDVAGPGGGYLDNETRQGPARPRVFRTLIVNRQPKQSLGLKIETFSGHGDETHRVTGVAKASPAGKAGIRKGDTIIKLAGMSLDTKSHAELMHTVDRLGTSFKVGVFTEMDTAAGHSSKRKPVSRKPSLKHNVPAATLTFKSVADEDPYVDNFPAPPEETRARRSVVVVRKAKEQPLGLKIDSIQGEGMVVHEITQVDATGPAGKAGLHIGDEILSIGGIDVSDSSHGEMMGAIRMMGEKFKVEFYGEANPDAPIRQRRHKRYITVTRNTKDQPLGMKLNSVQGDGSAVHSVSSVAPGGPADNAGLRMGNEVVEIGGVDVTHKAHGEMMGVLRLMGSAFKVGIYSEAVASARARTAKTLRSVVINRQQEEKLGLKIVSVQGSDAMIHEITKVPSDAMIHEITKVAPAGPAARAGLHAGDEIVNIGGHDVSHASNAEMMSVMGLMGARFKMTFLGSESSPLPDYASPRPPSYTAGGYSFDEKQQSRNAGAKSPYDSAAGPSNSGRRTAVIKPHTSESLGLKITTAHDAELGAWKHSVSFLVPLGPADRSGLHVGDEIVVVGDVGVGDKDHAALMKIISSMSKRTKYQIIYNVGTAAAAASVISLAPPKRARRRASIKRAPSERLGLRVVTNTRLGGIAKHEVAGIMPGSPAEKAGLKVGDVLQFIGSKDLKSMSHKELMAAIGQVGDRLELVYSSIGKNTSVTYTATSSPRRSGTVKCKGKRSVGMKFASVEGRDSAKHEVTFVAEGSPAAGIGIKVGDDLVSIAGRNLSTLSHKGVLNVLAKITGQYELVWNHFDEDPWATLTDMGFAQDSVGEVLTSKV